MVKFFKQNLFTLILLVFILSFFWHFFLKGLLPIPSDTIVGLYNPFLDYYAKVSPQGVPFQNFLITDPVRQIIPWKSLVIDSFANGALPLWNPYEMAGKPLLANFQSSPFYPFNIILLFKPFEISWSIFIILQPIMAGLFMFAYLSNLKLDKRASLLGSVTFAFSGFSVVWLEWGNILHTALWLPLILLATDKLVSSIQYRVFSIKNSWAWTLLVSLVFSFFAGHLQTFFYLYIISIAYFIFRLFGVSKKTKPLISFIILNSLFFILTFIQWLPTLQFISYSARTLDQNPQTTEGWFIPWQHLVQFLAPDFFGNPATLNYWGVWNYGEFSGYVGIVALLLAFLSLFIKKQKEIYFFLGIIIAALIFALPNPISAIPFNLSIPFISSAQPTRLIFLITFSLSVLSAFGFNSLISQKINKKWLTISSTAFLLIFLSLWLVVLGIIKLNIKPEDLMVAKRNLILPTGIFAAGLLAIIIYTAIKEELTREFLILAIIAISMFDLFRFGSKFTPFTNPSYFYPNTKVIEFLQKQKGIFRIAATDSRILAPNIATYYRIQTIEGYDPLYLASYAKLIAASERVDHSIKPPYGFNRIITPRNMGSQIIDMLNVRYVLSFGDLPKEHFKKVYSEGQTRVYENLNVLPRAYFVETVRDMGPMMDQRGINNLFSANLSKVALVEEPDTKSIDNKYSTGSAKINMYSENLVRIQTNNRDTGFLVLNDSYYPTWSATIDGVKTMIYKTNVNFRGIVVPKGSHMIEFKNSLL